MGILARLSGLLFGRPGGSVSVDRFEEDDASPLQVVASARVSVPNVVCRLRRAGVATVVAIGILVARGSAHASCYQFEVERAFAESSAVFLGRVLKNEVARTGPSPADLETVTTFEVERTWKGPRQRSIKVTACGGGDVVCTVGIEFVPGRDYLVFASGNRFVTSICRAFDTDKSDEPLQWLRRRPSLTPG